MKDKTFQAWVADEVKAKRDEVARLQAQIDAINAWIGEAETATAAMFEPAVPQVSGVPKTIRGTIRDEKRAERIMAGSLDSGTTVEFAAITGDGRRQTSDAMWLLALRGDATRRQAGHANHWTLRR